MDPTVRDYSMNTVPLITHPTSVHGLLSWPVDLILAQRALNLTLFAQLVEPLAFKQILLFLLNSQNVYGLRWDGL